jgi:hypothetical protein
MVSMVSLSKCLRKLKYQLYTFSAQIFKRREHFPSYFLKPEIPKVYKNIAREESNRPISLTNIDIKIFNNI